MSLVIPAVLPTSLLDLEEKLGFLTRIPSISRIQIDVVDGSFASPASWPYTAPKELDDMLARGEMLPELHAIEYEVDLMCLNAERAIRPWLELGVSRLTLHAESAIDLPRLVASVRSRYGSDVVSFGLALNITSDLKLIEPYLSQIDYIQFMGIATIGKQAQPFDRRVFQKILTFRSRHPAVPIQVDGGITPEIAKELVAVNVSNLVVGSAILRATDPAAVFARFEALQTSYGV